MYGRRGSGKRTLLKNHLCAPNANHAPLVDTTDSYRFERDVNGKPLLFEILNLCDAEIARQGDWEVCSYITVSNLIMIVYAVDSIESFDSAQLIKRLLDETIARYRYATKPILLVANKVDCENRVISRVQGEGLAMEWGGHYYETTASEINADVDNNIFGECVKIVAESPTAYHTYHEGPSDDTGRRNSKNRNPKAISPCSIQ